MKSFFNKPFPQIVNKIRLFYNFELLESHTELEQTCLPSDTVHSTYVHYYQYSWTLCTFFTQFINIGGPFFHHNSSILYTSFFTKKCCCALNFNLDICILRWDFLMICYFKVIWSFCAHISELTYLALPRYYLNIVHPMYKNCAPYPR